MAKRQIYREIVLDNTPDEFGWDAMALIEEGMLLEILEGSRIKRLLKRAGRWIAAVARRLLQRMGFSVAVTTDDARRWRVSNVDQAAGTFRINAVPTDGMV